MRSSRRRESLHRAGPMGEDFSGSCIVTSRNPLIHNGAATVTESPRFDGAGVKPCRCRVTAAAPDGLLATADVRELP